jgi:hypothetical protein
VCFFFNKVAFLLMLDPTHAPTHTHTRVYVLRCTILAVEKKNSFQVTRGEKKRINGRFGV